MIMIIFSSSVLISLLLLLTETNCSSKFESTATTLPFDYYKVSEEVQFHIVKFVDNPFKDIPLITTYTNVLFDKKYNLKFFLKSRFPDLDIDRFENDDPELRAIFRSMYCMKSKIDAFHKPAIDLYIYPKFSFITESIIKYLIALRDSLDDADCKYGPSNPEVFAVSLAMFCKNNGYPLFAMELDPYVTFQSIMSPKFNDKMRKKFFTLFKSQPNLLRTNKKIRLLIEEKLPLFIAFDIQYGKPTKWTDKTIADNPEIKTVLVNYFLNYANFLTISKEDYANVHAKLLEFIQPNNRFDLCITEIFYGESEELFEEFLKAEPSNLHTIAAIAKAAAVADKKHLLQKIYEAKKSENFLFHLFQSMPINQFPPLLELKIYFYMWKMADEEDKLNLMRNVADRVNLNFLILARHCLKIYEVEVTDEFYRIVFVPTAKIKALNLDWDETLSFELNCEHYNFRWLNHFLNNSIQLSILLEFF